jgi:hypothetical protein
MKKALIALAVFAAFGMSAVRAESISGGLNVAAGTISGQSAITGSSNSTAVSNLAGSGSSNFSTANQTGASTIVGGKIGANGLTTTGSQSTYSTIQTSGGITGGAQPFDSTGAISNGAGSFGKTDTAISVSGNFAKFGVAGNAFAKGF